MPNTFIEERVEEFEAFITLQRAIFYKQPLTKDDIKEIKDFLHQSLELQRERIIEGIEQRFYGANDVKVKDIIELIKKI